MRYTGMDHDARTGDPARTVLDERRTFARRIDCDASPRQAAGCAPARVGAPRDGEGWERSRRGYGG
jgi:hypothetical protein